MNGVVHMTLNQLQYVVEVAKTGSINSAASNLFVSQSVLSTAISNLEKEIGHAIFIRSNRGVTLTAFGHTFVSYVSSIQTQLDQLDHLISHGSKQQVCNLSIASTGYYFLDRICADIYQKYRSGGIRIELTEGHINNIADAVASQNADLGVINLWSCYKNSYLNQIHAKGLQYYPIAALNIAVTVGENNPLFHAAQEALSPEELSPFPTVMYSYNDSGPYSDIYNKLHLRDSGSRIVTSSRSVIYETLRNTDAFYLNSSYPFDLFDAGEPTTYSRLRTFPLKDCQIYSEIAWIKRADHALSMPANEVVNQIMHYFSGHIAK